MKVKGVQKEPLMIGVLTLAFLTLVLLMLFTDKRASGLNEGMRFGLMHDIEECLNQSMKMLNKNASSHVVSFMESCSNYSRENKDFCSRVNSNTGEENQLCMKYENRDICLHIQKLAELHCNGRNTQT